ncbi:hypothetical protein [Diplocloster modestus]|uniref:Uncharacterized protein n=1 Tax=Diplocloster modestus TaxID=2850322 RepID=A0ABS6K6Q0_9FIRM|nr:hypothetical protein [Diplocloster modestus]MBU9726168.1 hypothetical protein [Diplocloster modestus]
MLKVFLAEDEFVIREGIKNNRCCTGSAGKTRLLTIAKPLRHSGITGSAMGFFALH